MKNLKNSLLYFLSALLISSCSRRPEVKAISDQRMIVQVARMTDRSDSRSVFYRVRLIPDPAFLKAHQALGTDHFWYRMDSCFYLRSAGRQDYAALVQPVSNGAKDNYEYILEFLRRDTRDSATLVYQDREAKEINYQFKTAL